MTDGYEERYFDPRRDDPRRAAAYRQELERVAERTGLTEGTVLDWGCGLGELLDLFPSDRWQKYGVEVSQLAIRESEAKGISFELPEREEWCDLVVFRGTLQHLPDPVESLRRAHAALRPGGWLVALATPNAGGVVYRIFQDLPALDPPLNWVVFSDRILEQCLVNLGFRDVSFEYPYLGSPYASPARDLVHFAARFVGVKRPFAFWRNMMECYARR